MSTKAREMFGLAALLCMRCGSPQSIGTAREHRCRGGTRKSKPSACQLCGESFTREEHRAVVRNGQLTVGSVQIAWKGREIAAHIRDHIASDDGAEA